ncbi:MAG: hypothetical protein J6A29_06360 [Clostridia bacterium]|nr:hypothetical protein [Clostridia bacterium]
MPFIGIISDEKSENHIRRELLERLKINESSILFIKEKSIDNIKNIKFETVLLAREFKNMEILKKILTNTKYLIVNSDLNNNLKMLEELQLTVITYGFNSKATITISSVVEDKVLVCLQRDIVNSKGKTIEAQEFEIETNDNTNDIMGIVAILLIYENNI